MHNPENIILSTRAILDRVGYTPFLRRTGNGELGGIWELPGGKVDPGEAIETAAAREAFEESGIYVNEHTITPWQFEERIIQDGKHAGKLYRAFGAVATTNTTKITLDEVFNTDNIAPTSLAVIAQYLRTRHA